MVAELKAKKMEKESPILVRIFKEEAELEVWKKDDSGRFALLRTYPICRWSGQLGPKIKAGDRQAPEGFYTIPPARRIRIPTTILRSIRASRMHTTGRTAEPARF